MNIVFAEPIGLTAIQVESFTNEMIALGHTVRLYDHIPSDQKELLHRTVDADVLVVSNYSVSREVVEKAIILKIIVVAFTGVDHIPMDLCRSRGISVCNAAGYSTQAVAELTIALAINLYRMIVFLDNSTRIGQTRKGFLGGEMSGKTFGIIGFGAIGGRTAKLAQAFGCRVIAWSQSKKTSDGVEFVQLDQLLQRADIVTLHLPLTESTRGLINDSKLRLMKPNAILINTARGPIVDYTALAVALKNGVIAGAAVDVYEHEPPVEISHPLLFAPNTILLPHIGFATQEAINNRSEIVFNNIRSWLAGIPDNQIKENKR